MIKINDIKVDQDKFGDGTLKCILPEVTSNPTITWAYDNDEELFTLACLVDTLKERFDKIALVLPYIPNARQDRKVSGRIFTLKTFCNLINDMGFCSVDVLDPHSSVAMALLDRVVAEYLEIPVELSDFTIMYPDAGAAKKYTEIHPEIQNFIIGNKHRDTNGKIDRYDIADFISGTKKVLIIDDIVSYANTHVAAAKELKKRGVEKIVLMVSHCESNIFKGEAFDYIDCVYTTDSILNDDQKNQPHINKIKILRNYR